MQNFEAVLWAARVSPRITRYTCQKKEGWGRAVSYCWSTTTTKWTKSRIFCTMTEYVDHQLFPRIYSSNVEYRLQFLQQQQQLYAGRLFSSCAGPTYGGGWRRLCWQKALFVLFSVLIIFTTARLETNTRGHSYTTAMCPSISSVVVVVLSVDFYDPPMPM